jgi:CubicO group peptidase (beta-lactamase class C family)
MNAAKWCAAVIMLALGVTGCSMDRPVVATREDAVAAARPEDFRDDAPASAPEDEGLDSRTMIALTKWIGAHPAPIFSFLVSRNGRLVYELYTSSLTRDHAHYQMSVTKSVVSALVGITIDRGVIRGPDAPITDTLPRWLFASDADVARFRSVTVRDVLGMSALDAPDPPRVTTPETVARHNRFLRAPNRVKFALEQPLLITPGHAYQYNDVTPMLATGLVQYATGKSALEFAEEALFGPMGFKHYEWMHQDASGIDLGGYGLRLRPIDMQKFGVLYLDGGVWQGRSLISRGWVERSFTPWNRSRPGARDPDYGWFWWRAHGRSGWTAHVANGWKGQRIAVLPRPRLVVTMTGAIEDGDAERIFNELIDQFVVPSVRRDGALRGDPATQRQLVALLEEVRTGPSRVAAGIDPRMVPSITPKGHRVPFKRQAVQEPLAVESPG